MSDKDDEELTPRLLIKVLEDAADEEHTDTIFTQTYSVDWLSLTTAVLFYLESAWNLWSENVKQLQSWH